MRRGVVTLEESSISRLAFDGTSDFSYSRLTANTITSLLQQIRHRCLQQSLHLVEQARTSRLLKRLQQHRTKFCQTTAQAKFGNDLALSFALKASPRDEHTSFTTSSQNYAPQCRSHVAVTCIISERCSVSGRAATDAAPEFTSNLDLLLNHCIANRPHQDTIRDAAPHR